jgi:hypothetical protein
MTYDDARLATADLKETHDLIASDKVEGTRVFDPSGEDIGAIERVLIEKRSGKVAFWALARTIIRCPGPSSIMIPNSAATEWISLRNSSKALPITIVTIRTTGPKKTVVAFTTIMA